MSQKNMNSRKRKKTTYEFLQKKTIPGKNRRKSIEVDKSRFSVTEFDVYGYKHIII
jgi:hypothetical protein